MVRESFLNLKAKEEMMKEIIDLIKIQNSSGSKNINQKGIKII